MVLFSPGSPFGCLRSSGYVKELPGIIGIHHPSNNNNNNTNKIQATMAINDFDSDEHWIDTKLVGDARDDFPTIHPLKENVRAIVQVAKDRQGQLAFDRTLAREMNGLSMKEREQRFEEMHGVSSFIDETPSFVAEALWKLDQELASIPQKSAYNLAYSMDRSYVEDNKFRLMFLRADLFDAKKAAERLVLFFEKKLKFYGPATLVRSILMSDLGDDDITTLKSGVFQILPSRDRAGRPILFLCSNCGPKLYTSPLSFVRNLSETTGHLITLSAIVLLTPFPRFAWLLIVES